MQAFTKSVHFGLALVLLNGFKINRIFDTGKISKKMAAFMKHFPNSYNF